MNEVWNAAKDCIKTRSCVTLGTSAGLSGLRVFISKIQGAREASILIPPRPFQL